LFFTAFASGLPKVVYFIMLGLTATIVVLCAMHFYSNLYQF